MIDVPGIWRRVGPFFTDALFANFDRLLILSLFAALFALERRADQSSDPSKLIGT